MKLILTTVGTIAAVLVIAVGAQAQSRQAGSVPDLRKQIQELVAIDRDDGTLPDIKKLNRKFIRERKAKLRLLLVQRIGALTKYQSAVNAIIEPKEKLEIQEAISDLEKELKDLDAEMSDRSDSAASEVPATGPAAGSGAMNSTSDDPGSASTEAAASDRSGNPVSAVPIRSSGTTLTTPAAAEAAQPDPQPATGDKSLEAFTNQLEIEKSRITAEVVRTVAGKSDSATSVARTRAARIFGPDQNPVAFAKILSMNALPREQLTGEVESARVDKQVGGASSNAGSTSLVSKGSIPSILGFAVENGGLTQTNEGTTITFRGNPVGLFNALAGKGFITGFEDDSKSPAAKALRKLSFAASFDTSLGNTPNIFLGNKQQLSSYSFRYEFFNHRDPRDPRYAEKWAELVKTNAQPVATNTNRVQNLFRRDAGLRAWLDDAQTAIANAPDGSVETVVRQKLDELEKLELSPAVKTAVNHFSQSFSDYREKRDELLKIVANGPIFTVDYLNNRRPGLIDTSNLNFIYSTGINEGRASVTVNGALSFFNSQPGNGMSRLRDYDFSTQLDIPLGDPRGFGQFDLSFAGELKRLAEDEVVNGKIIAAKGTIGTFNLKLEVPIKPLGIKFPVAVTYSNRTEFDLKKQLRANFGFAFDPDFLYNLLKPYGR